MITLLDERYIYFPPVDDAHESGILALGGDLSLQRLTLAYQSGIFPWFSDGEPRLICVWYCSLMSLRLLKVCAIF